MNASGAMAAAASSFMRSEWTLRTFRKWAKIARKCFAQLGALRAAITRWNRHTLTVGFSRLCDFLANKRLITRAVGSLMKAGLSKAHRTWRYANLARLRFPLQ